MNSTIHISPNHVCNAVDRMGDTMVRFKFAKAVTLCATLAVHVRHPLPLHYNFDQRHVNIIDQVELWSPRQVTHLPPVWDILLPLA